MLRAALAVILLLTFYDAASARPAKWCGWWLGQYLGKPDRSLWLARNWARVGIITGRAASGAWIVKSGNDGRRVRERPRSISGAIALRHP